MSLRAFFCPCCGARLDPPSARLVVCGYCDSRLLAEPDAIVVSEGPPDQPEGQLDSTIRLSQARSQRFEMSWLHQQLVSQELDLLRFEELDAQRSALVYLRVCDKEGRSLDYPLPYQPLLESLRQYKDTGLAAHQALEWLCQQPQGFPHKLECAICLFDNQRARVTIYSAGCRDSIYWLSNEAGNVTNIGGYQEALERKLLLQAGDHFAPQPATALGALDAVVLVSAGYAGRGEGTYASGIGVLLQELRENLGEDPLRLVTLGKNAFWGKRCPAALQGPPPANSLHVVAVQARPQAAAQGLPPIAVQNFATPCFDSAGWVFEEDLFEQFPLHGQRHVLVWASNDGLPWSAEQRQALRQELLAVLDRPDHGDNENPRLAGRQVQAAVPVTRLVVLLLLDRYSRAKYYRAGIPHPLYLGPRGQESNAVMAFDEGGELTLEPGSRLLFLGQSGADETTRLSERMASWPGGKASQLYLSAVKLWTTPPTDAALQRIIQAVHSDGANVSGRGFLLSDTRAE